MRPLDPLSSIKIKLGVVIVVATAVTVIVISVGTVLGISAILSGIAAGVVALAMVQILARGMTSPLRDMAAAAREMASGKYDRRVQATSRDEVGELARAFNSMASELDETDRIRRDLIANVSHELRTPVSGLQAALENIVDGVAKPDPPLVQTMLAQTQRLGRLVNELLDLSRLESGSIELDKTQIAIAPFLEDCARESQIRTPEVAVVVDAPDSLVITADAERFRQVVVNLLTNAVRASSPGMTVTLHSHSADDMVHIEVIDTGPGIPDDERDRIFERFYRADAARSSDKAGAGLGLAIVRWIVDLHGGTVVPRPNTPHGCRMIVSIPKEV